MSTYTRLLAADASLRHVPVGEAPVRPGAARPRRHERRSRRGAVSRIARGVLGLPVLDAVVVGGGPAGLSAALVLGRARRRVLVLDTERPANAASSAVGGLLAQSGVAPADLRRAGRRQLADHLTVEVRRDEVVDTHPLAEGLAVTLGGGGAARTRALVLAHGLRYDPPALPGVEPAVGPLGLALPFLRRLGGARPPAGRARQRPGRRRSALVVAGWSATSCCAPTVPRA